jgi:hypothetical protein
MEVQLITLRFCKVRSKISAHFNNTKIRENITDSSIPPLVNLPTATYFRTNQFKNTLNIVHRSNIRVIDGQKSFSGQQFLGEYM